MTALAHKPIDEDVINVLRGAELDGPRLRITQQLDRPLYQKTAKVLKAIGGPWKRGDQAHVFEEDAAPLIADIVTTGTYFDAKTHFQFFETPDSVVNLLIEAAEIEEGQLVLEPSAGRGAIVRGASVAGADVTCVEKDISHLKYLADLDAGGPVFIEHDFLEAIPGLRTDFDAVVMNPPFARSQDIAHVRRAWQHIKPGGRLVAVMSPGFTFRNDRKAVEFRDWAHEIDANWEDLPEKSFRSSGTDVRTVLFSAQKSS